MKKGAPAKLIVKGKRLDGRKLDEMRPMEAKAGILKRAEGSGYFRMGNSEAIAAVHGPRELHPKHLQDPLRTVLRCRYNMVPFSTDERVRPGPSRRSTEISKVITQALNSVVFLNEFPKSGIDVFIEILQADASTRCVGLNAASIALADAGVPMQDLVASCSAGKIDGKIVLDLAGAEDMHGEVDIPVAYIPDGDKITLLQMDGIITKKEFLEALELAKKGCKEIYKKQKDALRKKYENIKFENSD
jgi:exosome complex component RRP41